MVGASLTAVICTSNKARGVMNASLGDTRNTRTLTAQRAIFQEQRTATTGRTHPRYFHQSGDRARAKRARHWDLLALVYFYVGSILALSRHRRRHVHCVGIGVPMLKMAILSRLF